VSIGDHRRALEYFGRVLIDYPDSPNLGEVLLQRGICQYKLGQTAEALQTFYRVVEEQNATELAAKAQKHINFINQKRGGKDE
jgi:TolA-binding protein